MTVQWYDIALDGLLDASIDVMGGDVVCVALGSGYTFDATHEHADDLTDVLGSPSTPLASKDITGGRFTADQPTITGTSSGDRVKGVAFYIDTGTPSTSTLLGFTGEAPGGIALDYESDGADILVALESGNLVGAV